MKTIHVLDLMDQERKGRSLREFAKAWDMTASSLSLVYSGRQTPGPKILRKLGLRKKRTVTVEYEWIKPQRGK